MNRANLIKEGIYYTLGILLIFGFVYLYWPHFRDGPGPPYAQYYLRTYFGIKLLLQSMHLYLYFLSYFCPFVIESNGVQRECFQLLFWLSLPKCLVCRC